MNENILKFQKLCNLIEEIENRLIQNCYYEDIAAELYETYISFDKHEFQRTIKAYAETQEILIVLQYLFISCPKSQKYERAELLNMLMKMLKQYLTEDTKNWSDVNYFKWQIFKMTFWDNKLIIAWKNIVEMNTALVKALKNECKYNLPKLSINQRDEDSIILFTNVFADMQNGPTRNLLDYSYNMKMNLHKKVLIVVAYDMPTTDIVPSFAIWHNDFQMKFNVEGLRVYNGNIVFFEYLDTYIEMILCKVNINDYNEIKKVLNIIYERKPALIYDIGGYNLLADLCGLFTAKVTIPCSFEFPVSTGKYLILPRKSEDRDRGIISYLKSNEQILIESHFVYKIEEAKKIFKKDEFKLNKEDFVIMIIGMRLDIELDDIFSDFLKILLQDNPKYYIVFIGCFNNYNCWRDKFSQPDRVSCLGYIDDITGILNIADVYLNTFRRGGGTSAVEALSQNVPVVTLPRCDVAYSCPPDFTVSNEEEILKRIQKYANDKEFYEEHKNLAYNHYLKVIDTKETIEGIITYIMQEEKFNG